MSNELRYSDHTETLTALVSYLALTKHKSRTPKGIGNDLGLNEAEVVKVLKGFPGIFRESKKPAKDESRKGQHFYTLHVRYALRDVDDNEEDDSSPREPLQSDYVVALLDMIAHRSSQERFEVQAARQNKITAIGAWVAAVSAMIAAIVSALGQVFEGSG